MKLLAPYCAITPLIVIVPTPDSVRSSHGPAIVVGTPGGTTVLLAFSVAVPVEEPHHSSDTELLPGMAKRKDLKVLNAVSVNNADLVGRRRLLAGVSTSVGRTAPKNDGASFAISRGAATHLDSRLVFWLNGSTK